MVRTCVRIPARGPIKLITNYSPAETYKAAAVLKPSNKKPNNYSSYISSSCSSAFAAISSQAAADQRLEISTAASSANAAIISRDGEAWQQMQIMVQKQNGDWSLVSSCSK